VRKGAADTVAQEALEHGLGGGGGRTGRQVVEGWLAMHERQL
jgi:hypothetical protein